MALGTSVRGAELTHPVFWRSKRPRADTRPGGMRAPTYTVLRVALLVAIAFLAEDAIMLVIVRRWPFSPLLTAFIDAGVLGVVMFPSLYLLAYLPLQRSLVETARLAAIVDSTEDAIIGNSLDGTVITWNRGAERRYGYLASEIIGRSNLLMVPPERRAEAEHLLECARRGESVAHLETVRLRKDGTPIDVSVTISPIRDARGEVIGSSAICRDITERRKVERALRASEALFRTVFERAAIGIGIFDERGEMLRMNPAVQKILGYSAQEIVGLGLPGITHPDDIAREVELLEDLWAGRRTDFQMEKRYIRKDGATVWGRLTVSQIVGELIGGRRLAVAMLEDITEQHHLDELRELLPGILAHDLRSPLSAIKIASEMLLGRRAVSAKDAGIVELIGRSAGRITHMVEQVLDFTRVRRGGGLPLERADVDLAEVCRDVISEASLANPGREPRLDLHGDCVGQWDRIRLAEAVSNLISNALKFGPGDTPAEVAVYDEGAEVVLEVRNAGAPIPGELLPVIFDPFRRGRSQEGERSGAGLGLGLYITREIVLAHGGEIAVRSTTEAGTSFIVRLPRRADADRREP